MEYSHLQYLVITYKSGKFNCVLAQLCVPVKNESMQLFKVKLERVFCRGCSRGTLSMRVLLILPSKLFTLSWWLVQTLILSK